MNVARALFAEQKFAEAERLFEAELGSVEAQFGRNAAELIPVLRHLAAAQDAQGRTEDAVLRLERALNISETSGSSEASRCRLLAQLGNAFRALAQLEKAMAAYERALDLSQKCEAPTEQRYYVRGLAEIVTKLDPARGLGLWERLVEMEQEVDPAALSTMVAEAGLGRSCLAAGERERGVAHIHEAIRILEERGMDATHHWVLELRGLLTADS